MPGPAKRAHSLKVIAGTERKSRPKGPAVPVNTVLEEVPDAPEWLPNKFAIAEWQRLAPMLVESKRLTEGTLSALAMLCSVHGQIVAEYSVGRTPMVNLQTLHRALTNDFGLSGDTMPSAASAAQTNRFARNGRRPGA